MPPADFYVVFHYRVDVILLVWWIFLSCFGFFFLRVAKPFHHRCCVSFQHDKPIDITFFLVSAPIGSVLLDGLTSTVHPGGEWKGSMRQYGGLTASITPATAPAYSCSLDTPVYFVSATSHLLFWNHITLPAPKKEIEPKNQTRHSTTNPIIILHAAVVSPQ